MGHRTWIKLYCDRWLRGSLRQDTPAVRGIWADILALAGDLAYGEDGVIKLAENIGLSDDQIVGILSLSLDEWFSAKNRLVQTGRISVDNNNIIKIENWSTYQSEYGRQKPYRHKKVEGESELAMISKLYEDNIAQITPMVAERLKDIAQQYPPGWFSEALTEAVRLNHRNLGYIEAILKRWKVEGFKSPKKKPSAPRRPGQTPTDEELDLQAKEKGVS